MSFLSQTVILVSLLIIQEFHPIDGSVEQIYEKVKQEVGDLIDSQDYESVDEIVKNSKVKVKYFDYYVPTTYEPTESTTTAHPPPKDMSRNGVSDSAAGVEGSAEEEEGGGSSMSLVIIIIVVVIIVLIVGAIGIFIYVRQSKTEKNIKNIKKKLKRSVSRESLSSIETVASETGKPIRQKQSKPMVAPAPTKPVVKKK